MNAAEERARERASRVLGRSGTALHAVLVEEFLLARREAILEEREACAVAICLPCQRGVPFASPNWHRDDHGYEYACNGGILRGRPRP